MQQMDGRIAERAREPRYTLPEGASFIDRPTSTVRRWSLGNARTRKGVTRWDEPLIQVDGASGDLIILSFLNLLELRFLGSYRRRVPLQAIRRALDYAAQELGEERPLLTAEFKVHGKSLFLRFAEQTDDAYLVNASERGQLAWPAALDEFIQAVDYEQNSAVRWWPLGRGRPVIIDTRLNGGLPSTAETGVRTGAIAVHRREGLEVAEIAEDVGARTREVEAALYFERVAA
jgi:uncharacterized protein (DUF433 family)